MRLFWRLDYELFDFCVVDGVDVKDIFILFDFISYFGFLFELVKDEFIDCFDFIGFEFDVELFVYFLDWYVVVNDVCIVVLFFDSRVLWCCVEFVLNIVDDFFENVFDCDNFFKDVLFVDNDGDLFFIVCLKFGENCVDLMCFWYDEDVVCDVMCSDWVVVIGFGFICF